MEKGACFFLQYFIQLRSSYSIEIELLQKHCKDVISDCCIVISSLLGAVFPILIIIYPCLPLVS
ncbi:Uncharacterized protein TCM_011711 [Theobroma cacao]|uniref:Uncharacterized protein n=1 Tax=Theobroma cacao TaxID=3641 RepID=A0A061EI04_THECC|nr:Uncharacterized protein TCM_011711 [Theobroma cacao]